MYVFLELIFDLKFNLLHFDVLIYFIQWHICEQNNQTNLFWKVFDIF